MESQEPYRTEINTYLFIISYHLSIAWIRGSVWIQLWTVPAGDSKYLWKGVVDYKVQGAFLGA